MYPPSDSSSGRAVVAPPRNNEEKWKCRLSLYNNQQLLVLLTDMKHC